MYHYLREIYWWDGSKRDIAELGSKCPSCQQVKIELLTPGGLTQIINDPT